jgi:hypothetical protein
MESKVDTCTVHVRRFLSRSSEGRRKERPLIPFIVEVLKGIKKGIVILQKDLFL